MSLPAHSVCLLDSNMICTWGQHSPRCHWIPAHLVLASITLRVSFPFAGGSIRFCLNKKCTSAAFSYSHSLRSVHPWVIHLDSFFSCRPCPCHLKSEGEGCPFISRYACRPNTKIRLMRNHFPSLCKAELHFCLA